MGRVRGAGDGDSALFAQSRRLGGYPLAEVLSAPLFYGDPSMHNLRLKLLLSLFLVGLGFVLSACEGEKPGDRCDGFFANGCKGNMTCFDTGSQKVCANSCDYGGSCEKKEGCCAAGFECHNTTAVGPGMPVGGAMMGGYCFKK